MPETGGASDDPRKGLTLDDLIAAIDRHERNPSNIPKVDTFHFCGERVSDWLERVEQALVGRSDVVKFQRILQYVHHSYHQEVKKVINAAQGSWERFKEGMLRKYRLEDGLLTTTDLEAMNKEDFTTIGAFVQEFKKRARKVHGISEQAQCAIFLGLLTASEAVELTRHGGGSTKLTWATIDKGVEVGCLDQVEQRQPRPSLRPRRRHPLPVHREAWLEVGTRGRAIKATEEGVEEGGEAGMAADEGDNGMVKAGGVKAKGTKARGIQAKGTKARGIKEVKAPGRPGVNVVGSGPQSGVMGRPLTPQARLAQAARTRSQAKASASQEPPRREPEQEKRKEDVEVEDDDDEEEEDERLRREEDQRAEQRARRKRTREEAEPVMRDRPPKKKKYAVRLEEGFDVERVIDRLLLGHNDLMTLKEILASAPRPRDELKGGPCLINEGNEGKLIIEEPDFLLPQERTLMVELMKRKHRAYEFSDEERGRLDVDKIPMIRIHTVQHEPWIMRGARYPNCDEEKKVVDYLDGKIRTHVADYSSRPYASPWFCFIKPNGTLRWVQDLQRLNAVTVHDAGGLPNADALSESCAGRPIISLIDLYSGYDQIPVYPPDRPVTAMHTPRGLIHMNVAPQGWTNAVVMVQRAMIRAMQSVSPHITQPYIDDLAVKGPAVKESDEVLPGDMEGKERPLRFESRTLCTTERNYSQFKRETLAVLHCLRIFRNYIFGRRFILRVDPTALAYSLRNYVPSDPMVARWLTYIWMFNFELERIPGSKNRADGLSRINWDKQEGEAVENMPPVAGFLDQEEDVRLHINKWSPRVPSCVGYPIWQAPSGYERRAELVLKPFEEEDPWGGKGVQWMMELALASSHSLVEDMRTIEEGPGQVELLEDLMRGMYLLVNMLLQESLDQSGSLNPAGNVDEVPESQDDEFEEGEIKEAFRAEEYDGIYLELGLLLSCERRLRDASDRAQRIMQRYLVRDDHLFVRREVGNPRRVVCGSNRQIDVIAALHDGIAGGHRGVQATYAKISELYYWDGMMDMIGKFCRSCVPYQERSRLRQGEPLHPRLEREEGAVVHLDLLFMPLGDQGYNYIFDARDNLSGFVDGRVIRTKTGPALVSCIEEYHLRYPFVREFVMVRGFEFTCQDVQELLSRSDFTKTAMPRGGKGTRPPRRPLGASGGYERHGPRHRESTPEYDGDDIELFLDSFWEHARRMGWTVAQGIERLRGVGRFEEPVARIRREATTRSEVEMRMQELRPSPMGPDGRPIRLEIGNASDFIPAFEWFMQGQASKAEERLDRKIKFLAKTTFDRHLLLESDLAGKKTREEDHGVRLEAMEVEIQELRALVASQAAIIESLRQQSQGRADKSESSRQGEQRQSGHGLPGQPSAAEARQEPPMGRVILEPEEARAQREAEREAFEFRAPTELATLPVAAAGPVIPLAVEEGLPPPSSEPPQGLAEGFMDVLLEAVHTMQEEASLFSPEQRIEEPLEREMRIEAGGVIEGGFQRLGTPEYGPEGIEDRPGPSTQEAETGEEPLDMP
ncbi:hypothetical protein CBR_g50827 [Chara braunii]|uniref:Reverse transcriptase n=1 Tax=Chara braunii TaxID=69332 RepID=A0A388M7C7_CHABU|nr:hypothetical protein CBR_g50827 [Chara braunii]|eukprot:GBG90481.1 hypothetical protein CBR_g50827 [Chara braunii]